MTDELIEDCKKCPEHVYRAQEDLEEWKKEMKEEKELGWNE